MTTTARSMPPAIWVLVGGQMLIRAAGFAYPFMTYLLDGRGYDADTTGWVLATFGAGWVVGQVLCGWLADHIGRRTTLLAAMSLSVVVLPVLGMAEGLPVLLVGAFLAGVIYDAARPVISAAVAAMVPDDEGRAWINGWRHFALNVGVAVAGAAGGLLAGPFGVPTLYLVNAAACAVFGLIVLRFVEADVPGRMSRDSRGAGPRAFADVRLWLVLLGSVGALVPVTGMFSALPLLMTADHLPSVDFGAVQVANAVTVLVLTPLINPWLSRRATSARPMVWEAAAGSLVMGTAMGAVGLADSTPGYVLAVVLSIPGEVVWFVAISDVLNRIAPERLRGLYNGLWGMTLAWAGVLTPLMAAWAFDHGGKAMVGASIVAAGVVGAVCCLPLARPPRSSSSASGAEKQAHPTQPRESGVSAH
ncbi:MFS transporter [Pseudonocardia spinosispora]|uniref:MFS transporter n=1 Tax=Pseudonocardia spinosispora TaxID=103441 RepID=UPI000411541B|nr:MFS transporter [Pseudonocardia spinosispora]